MSASNDHDREKNKIAEAPNAANAGAIRPPFVYSGAIVLGLVLRFIWPIQLMSWAVSIPIGCAALLIAVILFRYSARTFQKAGTPIPGNLPTTTIVNAGPYRFTRNPIYLSFSLFQIGAAFCANTPWVLLTLLPAISLMSFVVIPREERYLESHFPSEYLPYKKSVRRWL